MPRKKPTRKDNRYEYKLTIGRDIHGKPLRKSFYSTVSLTDAKKKAEEYRVASEVSARTGEAFMPSTGRFADWARKWLRTYKQPFVDVNTYELTYVSLVEGHLIPYFGAARLSDIRPADIQAYFAGKTECSESRLKKMRSILNALFECAIENDLCWKNPAKHSTFRSTARKHEKKVLTDEQIELAKAFTRDTMPEVALLLETGLRRGELLGLMWSDFDEREQTLSVRRSMALKHGIVTANPPKWDSYRTLPLNNETMRLIHALPHDSLYLFPNANGEPHSPNSWSQKLFTPNFCSTIKGMLQVLKIWLYDDEDSNKRSEMRRIFRMTKNTEPVLSGALYAPVVVDLSSGLSLSLCTLKPPILQ